MITNVPRSENGKHYHACRFSGLQWRSFFADMELQAMCLLFGSGPEYFIPPFRNAFQTAGSPF